MTRMIFRLRVTRHDVYDDYGRIRQESSEFYFKTKSEQDAAVCCLNYVT